MVYVILKDIDLPEAALGLLQGRAGLLQDHHAEPAQVRKPLSV